MKTQSHQKAASGTPGVPINPVRRVCGAHEVAAERRLSPLVGGGKGVLFDGDPGLEITE